MGEVLTPCPLSLFLGGRTRLDLLLVGSERTPAGECFRTVGIWLTGYRLRPWFPISEWFGTVWITMEPRFDATASMAPQRFPLAILASGTGSNLAAILEAAAADEFAAEVVVVISDRTDAGVLKIARSAGIPTSVVSGSRKRQALTTAVCDEAERYGARALVLAGFMRILGLEAIDRFPDAILNTHPSLLPSFPGMYSVRQALEHGVKLAGCTIHFLDEEIDTGPIIAQEAVAVLDADTEDTLHARIKSVEHSLYPQVVDAFARGRLVVQDRVVRWLDDVDAADADGTGR